MFVVVSMVLMLNCYLFLHLSSLYGSVLIACQLCTGLVLACILGILFIDVFLKDVLQPLGKHGYAFCLNTDTSGLSSVVTFTSLTKQWQWNMCKLCRLSSDIISMIL